MFQAEQRLQFDNCAEICDETARVCQQTIAYAAAIGRPRAKEGLMMALWDCIEACRTTSGMCDRRSPFAPDFGRACAKICKEAAEACASDDDRMQGCAELCHRCADACTSLATTV